MRILYVQTFWRANCFKTHTGTHHCRCEPLLPTLRGLHGESLLDCPSPSLQLVFTGLRQWSSHSITDFITWVCSVWKHKAGAPCVCVCVSSDEFRASTASLQLRDAVARTSRHAHMCVFMWKGCRGGWLNDSSDEGAGVKRLPLSKCLPPSMITLQPFFKGQIKVSTVALPTAPLSLLEHHFWKREAFGWECTWRTLTSFAGRSSVSRCTHTCAILWRAGSAILAGAAEWTVGSPEALWAHVITVDSCGHMSMTNIQWIHTKEVRWNIPKSLPSVRRQAGQAAQKVIAQKFRVCFYLKWSICYFRWWWGGGDYCFLHCILSNWASFAAVGLDLMGAHCQSGRVLISRAGSRERPSLSPIPFQQRVRSWKETFMGQVHTRNTVCLAEIDRETQNIHTGLTLHPG